MAFNKKSYIILSYRKRNRCNTCRRRENKGCVCKKRVASGKEAILGAYCWQIGLGDSFEEIDSAVSSWLMQFICKFLCSPVSSRSNTNLNFSSFDASKLKLRPSLSSFITKAWSLFFEQYASALTLYIVMFLWHGEWLGYKGPEAHILSSNLSSALLDLRKIDDKLSNNLVTGRISQVSSSPLFLCYPIRLVLKGKRRVFKNLSLFFPSRLFRQRSYAPKSRTPPLDNSR